MSFIGTSSTFSARGFGGLGNNSVVFPFNGTAIGYGTSGNKIFNIAMDSSNNLIGIYGDSDYLGGEYLFKYAPNTKRIYWVDNGRASSITGTTDGHAISVGNYSNLFPGTTNGTNTITGSTNSSFWRVQFSGVKPLNYVTADDNTVYAFRFYEANPYSQPSGGASIYKVTSTGTYINTTSVDYTQTVDFEGLITTTGAGITSANGKYVTIYGQYGSGIGTGTSDYTSGNYNKIISGTIVKYISKNAYCYIAYNNGDSVGIARLDASGTLSVNFTYTVLGEVMTATGLDVDVVNGYIFLSYNNGSESRIAKFTVTGELQWTRKLTAVGITQLLCSNDGLYYYLVSGNNIFQFPANGDILPPGTYTSGETTYTYSEADAWVSGTDNLLELGTTQYTWTSTTGTSTPTYSSGSPTTSTPLLTWTAF